MSDHFTPSADDRELTCAEAREMLSAYLDDELTPRRTAAVATHVAGCAECARDLESLRRTAVLVRGVLSPVPTPDVLRARVRSAIRNAEASAPVSVTEPATGRRRRRWPLLAAAGLFVAVASSAVTFAVLRPPAPPPAAAESSEAIRAHVRALMSGHLIDVASSDQHTVKPWFAGRTPFSPVVPRLDSLGYPLLGGRVDQVGDHAAAGIVYGLRKHYIDVYTWPAEARERTAKPDTVVRTERGYHTVHWIQGDMEYWAVSDVAEPDLRAFVTAFERYAGPESGNGPSTTSPE